WKRGMISLHTTIRNLPYASNLRFFFFPLTFLEDTRLCRLIRVIRLGFPHWAFSSKEHPCLAIEISLRTRVTLPQIGPGSNLLSLIPQVTASLVSFQSFSNISADNFTRQTCVGFSRFICCMGL